jgi:hypothetical protein
MKKVLRSDLLWTLISVFLFGIAVGGFIKKIQSTEENENILEPQSKEIKIGEKYKYKYKLDREVTVEVIEIKEGYVTYRKEGYVYACRLDYFMKYIKDDNYERINK